MKKNKPVTLELRVAREKSEHTQPIITMLNIDSKSDGFSNKCHLQWDFRLAIYFTFFALPNQKDIASIPFRSLICAQKEMPKASKLSLISLHSVAACDAMQH